VERLLLSFTARITPERNNAAVRIAPNAVLLYDLIVK